MSDQGTDINQGPGVVFWALGGLFVVWNLFGCAAYLMDVTLSDAAYRDAYGEAMAAVRDKYPAWSYAAYASAVWSGLAGAILLLLRKKISAPIFVFSLVAAVISFYWGLTNEEARAAAPDNGWVMPILVAGLGLIEIWWSRRKVADGTLR